MESLHLRWQCARIHSSPNRNSRDGSPEVSTRSTLPSIGYTCASYFVVTLDCPQDLICYTACCRLTSTNWVLPGVRFATRGAWLVLVADDALPRRAARRAAPYTAVRTRTRRLHHAEVDCRCSLC